MVTGAKVPKDSWLLGQKLTDRWLLGQMFTKIAGYWDRGSHKQLVTRAKLHTDS